MTTNWDGPYLQSYSPDDLTTPKSVTDNGRTVTYIYALRANGDYGAGEFRGGSATVPVEQRDNYPLIEEGDIVSAYTYSTVERHTIAQFIVTDITIGEEADGSGTIIYTGPGLSKELARKINRRPYIANYYTSTSSWYSETSVYLNAVHQQTDAFYNGGIYMMLGFYAEITGYDSGNNLLTVANWSAEGQPSGTTPQTYTIYHGKTLENLKLAADWDNTLWLNRINGIEVVGTPGGSWHPVEGKTCLEMLDIISKETGWRYRQELRDQPRRILDWFDPLATPVDSGIVLAKSSEYTPIQWQAGAALGVVVSCNRQSSRREGWTRIVGSTEDGITLAGLTLSDITVPSGFAVDFNGSMVINTAVEFDYHQSEIFEKSLSYPDIKASSDTPEAIKDAQISLFYQMVDTLRQKDSRNYSYNVTTVLRTEPQVGEQLLLKYERYVGSELQWDVDDDLWIRGFGLSADSTDGIRFITFQLGDHFDTEIVDGNKAAAQAIKTASSGGSTSVVYSQSSSPPSTLYRHSNLLGLGVVSDHPDYLLKDGSRTLTGNLIVDPGIKLDTVDLSVFKSTYDSHIIDVDAHHDLVTAGNHISISGQQVSVITTSNADSFPEEVLAGDVNGRIQVDGLGINTAPLGSGLDIAGYIAIEGNIDFANTAHITSDTGEIYVEPANNLYLRPVNKRIYVDDSIYFDAAGMIYTVTGNLLLDPFGDLDINANVVFQGPQSIKTLSGILTLAPEDDLALSPVGGNVTIAANLDFQGAYEITTLSGLLTIAPYLGLVVTGNAAFGEATDITSAAIKAIPINDTDYALYLKQRTNQDAYIFKIEAADSTDALLIVTKEGDLESGNPGFVTNTTGWQITHDGHAEFWSAKIRGELHATVFSADEVSSANGQLMVITSGVVDSPTNLPSAIGLTYTINIKASIATGNCPFIVNDILLVQFASSGGTGLDVWEVYSEVDAVGTIVNRNLANDEPGYFPLTCTWRDGGEADLEIPSPLAIVKWGTVSGTGLEGGIVMAADDPVNSPYIQVFTLPSAHTWGSPPVKTPRVHFGNLNGVMALGDEWGIAMAQDLSSTADENPSVVVGSGGVKLRNVDQMVYDSSGNPRVLIASNGNVKFGTDIDAAATTMFHFDPSAGSLALRNTTLESYNGALQTFELTPSGELSLGTNVAAADTTTFHVWPSGSVTIGDYSAGPYFYWDNNNSTLKLKNSSIELYGIDGLRHGNFVWDGSLHLGENTTTHASISFAHYGEASGLASGDIRIGTYFTGKPNMFWDQSAGKLSIRNYTTDMIVFEGDTGDSYFAGEMTIGINGAIRQGTGTWGVDFDGVSLHRVSGIGTFACYNNNDLILKLDEDGINIQSGSSYQNARAYSFTNESDVVLGGVYNTHSNALATNSLSLRTYSTAGYESYVNILSYAGSGKSAGATIQAQGDSGVGEVVFVNVVSDGAGSNDSISLFGARVKIEKSMGIAGGIFVGSYSAAVPNNGQIVIDQGTLDTNVLQFRSSDVTGMATQGMGHANAFGQFQKSFANYGGLLIKGSSESYHGIWLQGSAATDPAGLYESPIMLTAMRNYGAVSVGKNLLSLLNYTSVKLTVKEDGDLYIDGTYETFDHLESDVEMVRTLSLLSPNALRTQFDDFVRYNRQDLLQAKLIEDTPEGYMVNTTGMMRLHSGALWQLHQRISSLEKDISFSRIIKKFFSKVFVMADKRPN